MPHGKRRARNSVSISGALFANVFIPGGGVNNTTPVKQAGNGDGETFVHIKAGGKCWLASGGKDFETLVYFGGERARQQQLLPVLASALALSPNSAVQRHLLNLWAYLFCGGIGGGRLFCSGNWSLASRSPASTNIWATHIQALPFKKRCKTFQRRWCWLLAGIVTI